MLVAGLGAGLAEVLDVGPDPGVDDVSLAEPAAGVVGVAGDLLLGVGVAGPYSAVALLETASGRGVEAVALRRSVAKHPDVRAVAGGHGIHLVAVADEASWAHLAWLLREVLDRGSAGLAGTSDVVPDELFALAEACAGLLDAPVTIEDTRSRVLAYSGHEAADSARVSTIVGRRVPEQVVAALRARGVFRHLVRSAEPLFLPPAKDGSLGARLVVPVRAGGEWIGSVWAIVDEPVGEERLRPLREVTSLIALHLLLLRSEADLGRRLAADRLRAALAGDPDAAEALPAPPWRVVVLGSDPTADDVEARLAHWESVCRRASWQQPLLVAVGEDVVAVVADRRAGAAVGSWGWLAQVVSRVAETMPWASAAASGLLSAATELAAGLAEAREVARVGAPGGTVGREVGAAVGKVGVVGCGVGAAVRDAGVAVRAEDVWVSLAVSRAVAALGVLRGGPLADRELDPVLTQTLRVWLDHPTDLTRCAAELHVHRNTLRHRLDRLRAELSVDLADPTVRLALSLLLRQAGSAGATSSAARG